MSNMNTAELVGENTLIDSYLTGSITELVDDRITSVGAYAFDDCEALVKVDLPNVTSIGKYAFSACPALTTIILRSPTMVTAGGTAIFLGTIQRINVYVPKALLNTYGGDANWSSSFNNYDEKNIGLYAIEDYPDICG